MGTIACNCIAIGSLSKLLLETTGDGATPRVFGAGSKRLEFVYETLGTQRNLITNQAITGYLGNRITGVRKASYLTQGVIALQCSPDTLTTILPLVLGGTAAPPSFPLANTIPSFDVLIYRESGIFQYTNLRAAQMIVRGKTSNGSSEANEFIEVLLVCFGEQELITGVAWPGSEPALPTGTSSVPYQFSETDPYLNGVRFDYDGFKLTVDNKLLVKFFQHLYPTCIRPTGRDVMLEIDLPFNCATLAESLAAYDAARTAEILMEMGTHTTSFELPFARNVFKTPTTQGRDGIPLELKIQGFDSVGNDNLIAENA